MKIISLAIAIVLVASSSGCSMFQNPTQMVTITVNPPDAKMTVSGDPVQPPAKLEMKRNQPFMILCTKDGLEPYSRLVDTHLNVTGALDIVGCIFFLVPGLGLATPGAHSLDETAIYMDMFNRATTPAKTLKTGAKPKQGLTAPHEQ